MTTKRWLGPCDCHLSSGGQGAYADLPDPKCVKCGGDGEIYGRVAEQVDAPSGKMPVRDRPRPLVVGRRDSSIATGVAALRNLLALR